VLIFGHKLAEEKFYRVCFACVRNGYSLFCQKYLNKHAVSGIGGLKHAAAAWHQLPSQKKQRYQVKADKVCQEFNFPHCWSSVV